MTESTSARAPVGKAAPGGEGAAGRRLNSPNKPIFPKEQVAEWPQASNSLRRTLKEQDGIRKWPIEGRLPPLLMSSPSISYRPDDQVGDISMGELLSLIDFRVESAFAEREAPPARAYASKPKPYELSQNVRDAVDYIVKRGDEAELRQFLGSKPKDELAAIQAYLGRRAA